MTVVNQATPTDLEVKIVDLFVNILEQQEEITAQLKEAKEKAKKSNLNPQILMAVAKAVVAGKTGELSAKSKKICDVIDRL